MVEYTIKKQNYQHDEHYCVADGDKWDESIKAMGRI